MVKIFSLNAAGLRCHFEDIQVDKKLLNADMISLQETSLLPDDSTEELALPGYIHSTIKVGKGKGIAAYYDEDKFEIAHQFQSDQFQLMKLINVTFDVIFLYRSQGLNTASLLIELEKLIDTTRPTLILGDMNLCFKENYNNRLVQGLLKIGFHQLVQDPTHIQGKLIDHAYSLIHRRS